MTIEEIRANARDDWYGKDIAYRVVNGVVEYLTAIKGVDGKLSWGFNPSDNWINLETLKPL